MSTVEVSLFIGRITVCSTLVIAGLKFSYKFGNWQGVVNTKLENFHDAIEGIQTKLDFLISGFSTERLNNNSPLGLTDPGIKMVEELGAKDWAVTESKILIEKTNGIDQVR